jgi:hypothetical protein
MPTYYLTGTIATRNGIQIDNGNYGDPLTIGPAGVIDVGGAALYTQHNAWTVVNEGSISGSNAIVLAGGSVANSGSIYGIDGVEIDEAAGIVTNTGAISSQFGVGVYLADGGSVTNTGTGVISGGAVGVYIIHAPGSVTNSGTIDSRYGNGVQLADGGSVVNAAGGTISGEYLGVYMQGAQATLENAGTIGSDREIGVALDGSVSNRLIVDAGATFLGEADANAGAANTIELASSASAGTLTGLGSEYVGFQHLDIDAGAAWTVTGAEAGFNGVTIDFNTHDTLDLTDLAYTSGEKGAVFNRTSDILTIYNGASPAETLQFSGAYSGYYFHAMSDGALGTDITLSDSPACYCRGTLIGTSRGKVPVEDLTVGDLLITLSGELQPLKWIGRRSYAGWLAAGNPEVQPVLFKAGALADHVPSRDLMVSPEHAMYLDGMLIPARCLVNGKSIIQTTGMEEIHYFHLELEDHAVIFAEDAASETYLDEGNRGMFHNVYDYYAEFPDASRWPDARYRAPRIEDGFELEAARRALSARAALLRPDGTAAEAPELRGNLDRVTRTLVEGWALGPDKLVILDNGIEIGTVVPDRDHRFRFTMPTGFWTEVRHEIEIRRDPDWTLLPGSGAVLEPETLAA